MDPEQYNNIYNYLNSQQFPTTFTEHQKRQLQKQLKNFILRNNFIYKLDKRRERNLLRVIRKSELEPVLYMFHNDPTSAHFTTNAMFEKIRNRYYWPQMYEDIRSYVRSCDSCQRRGKAKNHQLLHPIPVESPFHQIGIDFVGPLPRTLNGNRYIIVAMDYLTKWPEAKPVPEATADQVATFLYEDIISRHGCPAKILSDQGSHFKNQFIAKLTLKFQIKHLFSTPYHPQTNGLVERFNRTLCESLAKLTVDHENEWDKYIAPVLFAYRTTKHNTTKFTPFFLVYGRKAKLPVDNLKLKDGYTLLNWIDDLVEELPMKRQKAKDEIAQVQQIQKDRHDAQIRSEKYFTIGQKVLYYIAAKEGQRSGKLQPNWKGPYYIYQVCANGSYKLRTMEGKVLKSAVNGSLLKAFYDRPNYSQ